MRSEVLKGRSGGRTLNEKPSVELRHANTAVSSQASICGAQVCSRFIIFCVGRAESCSWLRGAQAKLDPLGSRRGPLRCSGTQTEAPTLLSFSGGSEGALQLSTRTCAVSLRQQLAKTWGTSSLGTAASSASWTIAKQRGSPKSAASASQACAGSRGRGEAGEFGRADSP